MAKKTGNKATRSQASDTRRKTASAAAGSRKRPAAETKAPRTRRPAPAKSAATNNVPKPAVPEAPAGPVKSGLTRRDIEQFRAMLLEKRAELVGDVHTLRSEALKSNRPDAAGDLTTMPLHMADLGTDNYELEFTLGLIEGGRAVLQEIDEALDRIRQGTYGICLATGKPIGKARLRAKPWAKYSYEYVLAQETGKRR